MSYLATTLTACENIQKEIAEHFLTCQRIEEPIPSLQWLTSPINDMGLRQEIAPGQGKERTVNLRYDQRILESDVLADQTHPNCTASTERGDCVESYTIDTDDNEQVEEMIPISKLHAICRDNPTFFVQRIQAMIDALDRKIATKSATEISLLTGSYASNVDNVDVNDVLSVRTLRAGTTDELFPNTYQIINRAARKTGYCAPYIIFAGDTLFDYAERQRTTGCCANIGQDLGAMFQEFGRATVYDRRIANALGSDDHNLMVQNGSVAMLWWTETPWKDGVPEVIAESSNYRQVVVRSPRTGIPYDLTVKDDCGTVHITMTGTTQVVGLPTDLFPQGDLYNGVTFVNEILVDNS